MTIVTVTILTIVNVPRRDVAEAPVLREEPPRPASSPAVTTGQQRRRRAVSGLAAVSLVAATTAVAQSFGRFTFGVLLPAIRDDLGLSNTVAGSLAMANVGAYLVGTVVVAVATTRFRLLGVMRVGIVLAVAGLSLAAIAPGPQVLGTALFVMGLGGALTWIPAPVVAADAMAPERRAFAIGVLGSGMGLGVVFSGQLAGFVRSTMGDGSWRSVYVVQGLIGVAVVAAVWLFIDHHQDRPSSKAGIGGFSALRRMQGWLPFTSAMTLFGLSYLLVVAFLTTRLEDDSAWTSSRASLAFTVLGVAMVFGGPLFIALAGRIGPRLAMALAFTGWGDRHDGDPVRLARADTGFGGRHRAALRGLADDVRPVRRDQHDDRRLWTVVRCCHARVRRRADGVTATRWGHRRRGWGPSRPCSCCRQLSPPWGSAQPYGCHVRAAELGSRAVHRGSSPMRRRDRPSSPRVSLSARRCVRRAGERRRWRSAPVRPGCERDPCRAAGRWRGGSHEGARASG